jgi:hypothetical protein
MVVMCSGLSSAVPCIEVTEQINKNTRDNRRIMIYYCIRNEHIPGVCTEEWRTLLSWPTFFESRESR